MTTGNVTALGLAVTAFALSSCSKPEPGPAGPHFGTFCIQRQDWPKLIGIMKAYGAKHSLEFHGEVTDTPSDPIFNYYLAQGYSYYFGDDLDLWVTSDPFRPGRMDLNGAVKNRPITSEQAKLGHNLISAISGLSSCGVIDAE